MSAWALTKAAVPYLTGWAALIGGYHLVHVVAPRPYEFIATDLDASRAHRRVEAILHRHNYTFSRLVQPYSTTLMAHELPRVEVTITRVAPTGGGHHLVELRVSPWSSVTRAELIAAVCDTTTP
jgi:hypothetical protein